MKRERPSAGNSDGLSCFPSGLTSRIKVHDNNDSARDPNAGNPPTISRAKTASHSIETRPTARPIPTSRPMAKRAATVK